MTPEEIEIGNFAMLVERGLEPNVAHRVAQQYTEKCAENERLRAALTIARQWMPVQPLDEGTKIDVALVDAALKQ